MVLQSTLQCPPLSSVLPEESTSGNFISLNDTSDTSAVDNLAVYVSLVSYPILFILCTCGNALNIIVISRLVKAQTKEVLLIGLAISDLLAL